MNKILFWLTSFLPFREISDGDTPYLERYHLFGFLGWRFYIHRFVGSDPDRGLHDHPWARAYSIILNGWYWEHTRSGVRKVRWFNSLVGDNFHRVVLPTRGIIKIELEQGHRRKYLTGEREPQPCWTLFFHTDKNVKPWGFWRPLGYATKINPECKDAAVFAPYQYTREGSQKEWWVTAKRRPCK